jgi:hypothetical protein
MAGVFLSFTISYEVAVSFRIAWEIIASLVLSTLLDLFLLPESFAWTDEKPSYLYA